MKPKINISHVSFSYHSLEGETPALSDISLSINNGEFLAIVGPSGCGKSTLLSLLSGLLKPEEGTIDFDGNIGYMLQRDHLFEWRTIYENVALGLEIQKKLTPENKKMIYEMLNTYGLGAFAHARPSELSGGMRQRAALIRTLVLKPDILLLDEPFSALDYQTRLAVGDDIGAIIKKEKKTAVLVTHDLSEAVSLGDRIVILTKRPGRLQNIIPIAFEEEYNTPLKRRNAPEFPVYFNQLWKEMNPNG